MMSTANTETCKSLLLTLYHETEEEINDLVEKQDNRVIELSRLNRRLKNDLQ